MYLSILALFIEWAHSFSQWDLKVRKVDNSLHSGGQKQLARQQWENKMTFRERYMQ